MFDFFLGKSFDERSDNEALSIIVKIAIASPFVGYFLGPFEYSLWGILVKVAYIIGVLPVTH